MRGKFFVFVFLGPRVTHGRALGRGSFIYVKGPTVGRALSNVTPEVVKERMAIAAFHDARSKSVLEAGGIYCVYHAQDRMSCNSQHED